MYLKRTSWLFNFKFYSSYLDWGVYFPLRPFQNMQHLRLEIPIKLQFKPLLIWHQQSLACIEFVTPDSSSPFFFLASGSFSCQSQRLESSPPFIFVNHPRFWFFKLVWLVPTLQLFLFRISACERIVNKCFHHNTGNKQFLCISVAFVSTAFNNSGN